MKRLNLNEIPQVEYNGYLWFDNSDTPDLINGLYDFNDINTQPFIIEGNLKSTDDTISVSIRFLDGEYFVVMVEWDRVEESGAEIKDHEYIAHGFKDYKTIHFKEAWLPEKDEHCEYMEVLRPAWIAFDGFDKPGEE